MEAITSFGNWLRRRRKALDLTQAELAQCAGCAPGTIKSIEADARRPSKQLAGCLADCLELRPEDRALFLKVARAELAVDQLLPPTIPLTQAPRAQPHTAQVMEAATETRHALPGGTVTFLFTDIEGSTQLWEQHPQAMRTALACHDTILREAIAAAGGVVVKSTGDGLLVAFDRAPDALQTALAAQRALQVADWSGLNSLRVRMALHTGVAEARVDDYFGPPLNRLARLLAAGHGGQILLSRTTAELLADHLVPDLELCDLGEHRLKDLSRPERIYQLVAPDLPREFPPLKTLSMRPNNLPVQPTPLIGRDADVTGVCILLRRSTSRLVTLTGPGGVGKTRLALQVAAELLDVFRDCVYFVTLASISDPRLVATTIAQAIGIKETNNQSLVESFRNYLDDKHILLLLDNFEQVVTAAPFVSELLAAVRCLQILVTSREVLRLRGEKEFVVQPLALPDPGQVPPIESLSQYAAVALFIQLAMEVKPDFTLTNANAPAVAKICTRLDGLPLAIELAAARIKLFTPEALLVWLEQPLALLTSGARDLPTRQQTLRNTIAWSYNLLSAAEQTLFRRLAVFVGGCTVEAAEAICNEAGSLPLAMLDGLVSLLDKNLLRYVEGVASEPRFMLLETIREYALEQLRQSATKELDQTWERYLDYFLALAERAAPMLRGAEQLQWLDRLEKEHDNLRAALQRSIDQNDTAYALKLSVALWRFWWAHGHSSEGGRWLENALAQSEGTESALRAAALSAAGFFAHFQGDYQRASTLGKESLELCRQMGDEQGIAVALDILGLVARSTGDYATAQTVFEECLALGRASGERSIIADALFRLGNIATFQGNSLEAYARYEQSLALYRELKDQRYIAWSLGMLAHEVFNRGDLQAARPLLRTISAIGSKTRAAR